MNVIILAAGYATRLYPLSKENPKSLIDVGGKPILEHIIRKLELDSTNNILVVTNDKFYGKFNEWLEKFKSTKPIKILNDGTRSNDDRLGAMGDVKFALEHLPDDDDFMVIAGDNLFELSIIDVVNFYKKKKSSIIVLYDVKSIELARQYGIVEINTEKLLVNFTEKPVSPKSTLASTVIYIFPKKIIPLVQKYFEQGNDLDKTGKFIEWLHKRDKVYCFVTEKKWFDIGSVEQLEKADKHYSR